MLIQGYIINFVCVSWITLDGSYEDNDEYFQRTEESDKFRSEYEMRKMKQESLFSDHLIDLAMADSVFVR